MKRLANTLYESQKAGLLAFRPSSFPAFWLCGLLAFMFFLSSGAESAFTERGGVRPMGMGGAFVALADDTSAIMFNPAGLGQIERSEFTAAYDRLYAGLGDDSLGRGLVSYVHPSRFYGAFAVNTSLLHTPLYRETTVAFGYGRPIGPAYLGMNAKGLFASYEENEYTELDPLFTDGMSTSGVALDLGMLYKLADSVSFGLAVLNVNQPDMALGEDAESKVPYTLQTGIALKLGSTVPTVDLTYRSKKLWDKQDVNVHFGIESWLAGRSMALRAGMNLYDMAVGASYVFNRGKDLDAQLDYAFRYPLVFKEDTISGIYGTHQFSLNIRFGGFAEADRGAVAEGARREYTRSDASEVMAAVTNHREQGKYQEGIDLCSKVLEMSFEGASEYHLEADMQMAAMLNELGRYDEALEALQAAVKIAPQNPQTHYELGMAYSQYGHRTGNISWYNRAIIEFEEVRIIDSKFRDVSTQLEALREKR